MRSHLAAVAASVLFLGAQSSTARAQQFIGTVVLPDGQTPAPGVLVAARDGGGREVAQAVSGAEGRFTLFVDSGATVRLRLYREGFAPTDSESRTLGADEIADVVAVLGNEPVRLSAFPRGAASCGRSSAEGEAAVAVLLEEARKTFLISQAAIGRNDLEARFATFDHRLAKTGEDTLRSVIRRSRGSVPSPFRATTAEELEADGFFATVSGERVFRAPDPALLASPWFTATHCFTLVAPRDSAMRLEFQPRRERRGLVDVEGAFHFDPGSLALLGVDYRYQGLREEERKSGASVQMEFVRTVQGEPVLLAWRQRFPLLGYRQSDGATTFVRTSMTLIDIVGHRTVGGQLSALLRDGAPILLAAPQRDPVASTPYGLACPERVVIRSTGAIEGVLVPVDSESVAGVVVRVKWGDPVVVDRTTLTEREQIRESVADANGRWVVCDVPAKRPLSVVWEQRGQERVVPFTLEAPATLGRLP